MKTATLRNKKRKKRRKLAIGPSHSDAVAITAPVHCPTVPAYLGITGGTFCEVLVCG